MTTTTTERPAAHGVTLTSGRPEGYHPAGESATILCPVQPGGCPADHQLYFDERS